MLVNVKERFQEFWMSLLTDLPEEDMEALMNDWTRYGIVLVENVEGVPQRSDPRDLG